MGIRIGDRQGFAAGTMFLAIGAGAAVAVSGYRMGTALHMGPGYYPLAVSLLLAAAGIGAMLRSVVVVGTPMAPAALRPAVLVALSAVVFALVVDRAGLVPATGLTVGTACLAVRPVRLGQAGLLAGVLAVLAVGIFIYGLKLPFSAFG